MRWSLIFLLGFWAAYAQAFSIPKGLSHSDRDQVIQTLGLSSATKILTNPYPLGGYSGFEIGYSVEFVNVEDLDRLGCAPGSSGCANSSYQTESEWHYSRLTIGKGLYNDVDIFFFIHSADRSRKPFDYGGTLRWSFYQAKFLPINVSLLLNTDQMNFQDEFINRNVGAEILAGVNVNGFSLYFGGGQMEATGTFFACSGSSGQNCTVDSGDAEVNGDSSSVTQHIQGTNLVVGLSLHYDNLFAAAEVDRYRDAVYSMKVGLRF